MNLSFIRQLLGAAIAVVFLNSAAHATPGDNPACVTVSGAVTYNATSTLTIDIGGPSGCNGSNTDYDRLTVDDLILSGGTLAVRLANNYVPATGQTFKVLHWNNSISGTFANFDFSQAALPFGLSWDTSQIHLTGELSIDDTIVIDSEPALQQALLTAPVGATLAFAPALDGTTMVLSTSLVLTKSLTISAASLPNGLTLDGSDSMRVLYIIEPSIVVSIERIAITRGMATRGAGIENNGGILTLTDVTLFDNHASTFGGGLFNAEGTVIFRNSTLEDNTAGHSGGGVYNFFSDATLINSSFAGNSAGNDGGALYNHEGVATLNHTTVSNNDAFLGGGMFNLRGTVRVENSIVAGNTSSGGMPDISSDVVITAAGQNLIGNNAGATSSFTAGPFVGTATNPLDPRLAPLGDFGGPTRTMHPLFDSPLINAALDTVDSPSTDQRGELRPGTTLNDIGAVEGTPDYGVVTTKEDDGSAGSLRQILDASPPGWTVTFAPGLDGQTILLNSQLDLLKDVSISAATLSAGVILDGNDTVRVLEIQADVTASIDGLTITRGNAGPSSGGGILNAGTLGLLNVNVRESAAGVGGGIGSSGMLTITASTIENNDAIVGGGIYTSRTSTFNLITSIVRNNNARDGGGISHSGPAPLVISDSSLVDNHATGSGGALWNDFSDSTTLMNSTLSGNSADFSGGALYNHSSALVLFNSTVSGNSADSGALFNNSGELTLVHATITDNHATSVVGGVRNFGVLHLENTIVAGNTGGNLPDILHQNPSPNTFFVAGVNLIGNNNGTVGIIPAGPFVGTSANPIDAGLAPLGNYGGPTQTMRPLVDSIVIDAAIDAVNPQTTDQRGFARPLNGDQQAGAEPDIGAVEFDLVRNDLTAAMDDDGLQWVSSGDAAWFGQTGTTQDGMDALQSGGIGANEQSTVETTIDGPGTLTFWWKVSSQQSDGVLRVSVDGVLESEISGEVDWQQITIELAEGAHNVSVTYDKGANGSDDDTSADTAWIDLAQFTPLIQSVDQIPTLPPVALGLLGLLLLASARRVCRPD